jgi:hypothetical protein
MRRNIERRNSRQGVRLPVFLLSPMQAGGKKEIQPFSEVFLE